MFLGDMFTNRWFTTCEQKNYLPGNRSLLFPRTQFYPLKQIDRNVNGYLFFLVFL